MSEETTVIDAPTDATPTDATGAPSWYGDLPEDLTESKSFFDQFKDRDAFFKSAKETKAALSRKLEGYIKAPGEGASDEDMTAYRSALGIPDSPDGYEVQIDGLPEGMDWDLDALTPFKEIAAAEGVPAKAFAALIAKQAEVEAAMFSAQQEAIQEASESLMNEWGDDYDYKLADIAGRVGDKLDLDQPFLSRVDVLRALDDLAKDFRDDTTGTGKPLNSGMSLNDQISKITSSDEYRSSTHPKHKETRAQLHALYAEQAKREQVGAR